MSDSDEGVSMLSEEDEEKLRFPEAGRVVCRGAQWLAWAPGRLLLGDERGYRECPTEALLAAAVGWRKAQREGKDVPVPEAPGKQVAVPGVVRGARVSQSGRVAVLTDAGVRVEGEEDVVSGSDFCWRGEGWLVSEAGEVRDERGQSEGPGEKVVWDGRHVWSIARGHLLCDGRETALPVSRREGYILGYNYSSCLI